MIVKAHCYPATAEKMKIGLFGGSFNPPHEGHAFIAKQALKFAGLDRVWMLATPGNPLKNNNQLLSYEERKSRINHFISNRNIIVSDIEFHLNHRYSVETLAHLVKRFPKVQFYWIIGADNLANFHHWHEWQKICQYMPLIIFDRPNYSYKALKSIAATRNIKDIHYNPERLNLKSASIQHHKVKSGIYLFSKRYDISSTKLRGKENLSLIK